MIWGQWSPSYQAGLVGVQVNPGIHAQLAAVCAWAPSRTLPFSGARKGRCRERPGLAPSELGAQVPLQVSGDATGLCGLRVVPQLLQAEYACQHRAPRSLHWPPATLVFKGLCCDLLVSSEAQTPPRGLSCFPASAPVGRLPRGAWGREVLPPAGVAGLVYRVARVWGP